jgi:hypothetical protein
MGHRTGRTTWRGENLAPNETRTPTRPLASRYTDCDTLAHTVTRMERLHSSLAEHIHFFNNYTYRQKSVNQNAFKYACQMWNIIISIHITLQVRKHAMRDEAGGPCSSRPTGRRICESLQRPSRIVSNRNNSTITKDGVATCVSSRGKFKRTTKAYAHHSGKPRKHAHINQRLRTNCISI